MALIGDRLQYNAIQFFNKLEKDNLIRSANKLPNPTTRNTKERCRSNSENVTSRSNSISNKFLVDSENINDINNCMNRLNNGKDFVFQLPSGKAKFNKKYFRNKNNGTESGHSEKILKHSLEMNGDEEALNKTMDELGPINKDTFDMKIKNMLLKTLEGKDSGADTLELNDGEMSSTRKRPDSEKSFPVASSYEMSTGETSHEQDSQPIVESTLPNVKELSDHEGNPDIGGITLDDENIRRMLRNVLEAKNLTELQAQTPLREYLTFSESEYIDAKESENEKPKVLKFLTDATESYRKTNTKTFGRAADTTDSPRTPNMDQSCDYENKCEENDVCENCQTGDKELKLIVDKKITKSRPIIRSQQIRAFNIDPFDNLIKSHLSPTDRRLVAISKKANCNIKIINPRVPLCTGGCAPITKGYYQCFLMSDKLESVAKCLKCLQDCFPDTRFSETNVPASII